MKSRPSRRRGQAASTTARHAPKAVGRDKQVWNVLTGGIPPDPPYVWIGDPLPPSKIIALMRIAWKELKGGSAEEAQFLFEHAGPWNEYWMAARRAGDKHDLPPGPSRAPSDDKELAKDAILVIRHALDATLKRDHKEWLVAKELAAGIAERVREIQQARVRAWRQRGGEASKARRGPLRRAAQEMVRRLREETGEPVTMEALLKEIRKDCEGDSDIMDDIRGARSDPVDLRWHEIPSSSDPKAVVRFSINSVDAERKLGSVKNELRRALGEQKGHPEKQVLPAWGAQPLSSLLRASNRKRKRQDSL